MGALELVGSDVLPSLLTVTTGMSRCQHANARLLFRAKERRRRIRRVR